MTEEQSIPQNAPRVVIVSPALRDANNGNWQTAQRWQRHLHASCAVRIVKHWPDDLSRADEVMIALHARHSAEAVFAWSQLRSRRLAVVLTGTDLYRDIRTDAAAQRVLELAQVLVVLQDCAPFSLPEEQRKRARVIFQSTSARQTQKKSPMRLRALMVGHLRAEKAPETLFAAARHLVGRNDIFIDHIGAALDPALGEQAMAAMRDAPNYRWLGARSHEETRRRIARAHVLIHASRMEGGAHVIMEAVTSGTPVIASRVDGNVGMLGAGYSGYFPVGDARELAALVVRCQESRCGEVGAESGILTQLADQCLLRAPLFEPISERNAVRQLVHDLI